MADNMCHGLAVLEVTVNLSQSESCLEDELKRIKLQHGTGKKCRIAPLWRERNPWFWDASLGVTSPRYGNRLC